MKNKITPKFDAIVNIAGLEVTKRQYIQLPLKLFRPFTGRLIDDRLVTSMMLTKYLRKQNYQPKVRIDPSTISFDFF